METLNNEGNSKERRDARMAEAKQFITENYQRVHNKDEVALISTKAVRKHLIMHFGLTNAQANDAIRSVRKQLGLYEARPKKRNPELETINKRRKRHFRNMPFRQLKKAMREGYLDELE